MRAISTLRRDDGMSTRLCRAMVALRMRASMSAIGSVILVNLQYVLCATVRQCHVRATCVLRAACHVRATGCMPRAEEHVALSHRRTSHVYQLLFVTPAMSPSSASLRKQSRHSANLRRNARG